MTATPEFIRNAFVSAKLTSDKKTYQVTSDFAFKDDIKAVKGAKWSAGKKCWEISARNVKLVQALIADTTERANAMIAQEKAEKEAKDAMIKEGTDAFAAFVADVEETYNGPFKTKNGIFISKSWENNILLEFEYNEKLVDIMHSIKAQKTGTGMFATGWHVHIADFVKLLAIKEEILAA